jgi:hypothetical protein
MKLVSTSIRSIMSMLYMNLWITCITVTNRNMVSIKSRPIGIRYCNMLHIIPIIAFFSGNAGYGVVFDINDEKFYNRNLGNLNTFIHVMVPITSTNRKKL